MNPLRLLISACPTDEHSDFGRLAIVTITPRCLRHWLSLRNITLSTEKMLKKEDERLVEIRIDGGATFYRDALLVRRQRLPAGQALVGALVILGDDSFVVLEQGDRLVESSDDDDKVECATECDEMLLTPRGVMWFAARKWEGTTSLTQEITWDELTKLEEKFG